MTEIRVSILSKESENDYAAFLAEHSSALLYHSLKYRIFLKSILANSDDIYLLAYQQTKLVGILPAFIKHLDNGLSIVNSLPFFGSHGGMLISARVKDSLIIKHALMDKLVEIAREKSAISLTLIEHPLISESDFYKQYLQVNFSDQRISQMTNLTVVKSKNIAEQLMEKFHSKTRNMVRKSLKSGFIIKNEATQETFKQLYNLHAENMEVIGGKAKEFFIFETIFNSFEAEKDYRIYLAEKDGEIAAILLVFFYKKYGEYFTPAINEKFRSQQPLSFLIFRAMNDAVERGIHYWNWGGTWLSQEGVYLFKKRWGAEEKHYYYFTKVFNEEALIHDSDTIFQNAPYFYVQNVEWIRRERLSKNENCNAL